MVVAPLKVAFKNDAPLMSRDPARDDPNVILYAACGSPALIALPSTVRLDKPRTVLESSPLITVAAPPFVAFCNK